MNIQFKYFFQSFIFIFALIHGDHYIEKDSHKSAKSLEEISMKDAEELENPQHTHKKVLSYIKDEIKDGNSFNGPIKPDYDDISSELTPIDSTADSSGDHSEIKGER